MHDKHACSTFLLRSSCRRPTRTLSLSRRALLLTLAAAACGAQFRGSEENPADEEVLLTTGPDATGATHWGQQTFFMHPEIEAAQGDSLRLKLLIERKKENHRLMRVTITHKLQGTSDMARSASEETRVFHIE